MKLRTHVAPADLQHEEAVQEELLYRFISHQQCFYFEGEPPPCAQVGSQTNLPTSATAALQVWDQPSSLTHRHQQDCAAPH